MKIYHDKQHIIDLLFPLGLLAVFALSALTIITMSTSVYKNIVKESAVNEEAQTSLAYISEKLHQNDADGAISITTLDGQDALMLSSTQNGKLYHTYIYLCDGALRELFVRDDAVIRLSSGQALAELESFSLEMVTDRLIRITCVGNDGRVHQTDAALRSCLKEVRS